MTLLEIFQKALKDYKYTEKDVTCVSFHSWTGVDKKCSWETFSKYAGEYQTNSGAQYDSQPTQVHLADGSWFEIQYGCRSAKHVIPRDIKKITRCFRGRDILSCTKTEYGIYIKNMKKMVSKSE